MGIHKQEVIKQQFDYAEPFRDGLARVTKDPYGEEMIGYINAQGKYIWKPAK